MYGKSLLLALGLAVAPVFAAASPRPVVHHPVVIVVDPGHGGTNDGCASPDGTVHEKDVTLRMARRLRARLLEDLPHATVVLTRSDDETLTLAERVTIANRSDAAVFISLHANASPARTQQGFETYLLDLQASGLEAARTALRENDAGFIGPRADGEVATMLRELRLTSNRKRAAFLASAIQAEQAERFPGRVDRGVKQAPFDVLMGTRMPAVLFEVGFLDHEEEGTRLLDAQFQDSVVAGLSSALVRYYREVLSRE